MYKLTFVYSQARTNAAACTSAANIHSYLDLMKTINACFGTLANASSITSAAPAFTSNSFAPFMDTNPSIA